MAAATPQNEKRLLGISLKMYFDTTRTRDYIESVAQLAPQAQASGIDLFVLPDFLNVATAATRLENTGAVAGAQNCHWEESGAFTGEVSARNLAQVGAKFVAMGHAERRRMFGETDADVARKAAAAAKQGLVPLVCIGEKGRSGAVASAAVGAAVAECEVQVRAALSLLPSEADVVFAYEPVWAIGASEPAGADHVVGVTKALRAMLQGRRGSTRILYGGSAGPGTFENLKAGVDGLFLGRFGHDPANLEKVIREMSIT